MSKLKRSDFIAHHGPRSLDLQKLADSSAARRQLGEAGLGVDQLRRADANHDDRLDAGEAFHVADDLDRDGFRHSLIDVDRAGNATPAGRAVDTLGLLLQNRDLQAQEPSATAGPEQLKALGKDLRDMPSQLSGGRLQLDPALLARVERDFGPAGRARLEAWQQLTRDVEDKSDEQKILLVDSFFAERVSYRSDIEIAGESDYWQSPVETLASGQGDCEDYAIAKYATLRLLGFPPERVDLAVVRTTSGQGHAVTLADPGDGEGPLVMDNLAYTPVRQHLRTDLTPRLLLSELGCQHLNEDWRPLLPFRLARSMFRRGDDALDRSASVLPED